MTLFARILGERAAMFYAYFCVLGSWGILLNMGRLINEKNCACSYVRNSTFFKWSGGFVNNCIHQVLGDKCMQQYTKHVYVKLPVNFEILKGEIERHALFDNSKTSSTQWDFLQEENFASFGQN